jgi:hypothetical protein
MRWLCLRTMLRWTTLTLLAAILPRAVLAIDISAATERALKQTGATSSRDNVRIGELLTDAADQCRDRDAACRSDSG